MFINQIFPISPVLSYEISLIWTNNSSFQHFCYSYTSLINSDKYLLNISPEKMIHFPPPAAKKLQICVNHSKNITVPAVFKIRLMNVMITGSIPVGIVSARQRLDQEKVMHRAVPGDHVNRDLGSMPLPPSGPLVSGIGLPGKKRITPLPVIIP